MPRKNASPEIVELLEKYYQSPFHREEHHGEQRIRETLNFITGTLDYFTTYLPSSSASVVRTNFVGGLGPSGATALETKKRYPLTDVLNLKGTTNTRFFEQVVKPFINNCYESHALIGKLLSRRKNDKQVFTWLVVIGRSDNWRYSLLPVLNKMERQLPIGEALDLFSEARRRINI